MQNSWHRTINVISFSYVRTVNIVFPGTFPSCNNPSLKYNAWVLQQIRNNTIKNGELEDRSEENINEIQRDEKLKKR